MIGSDHSIVVLVGLLSTATLIAGVAWTQRLRARSRLYDDGGAGSALPTRPGAIRRWLIRAGIRGRTATAVYLIALLAAFTLAAVAITLWFGLGLGAYFAEGLVIIPGPAGALLAAIVQGGPMLLVVGLAALPWLYVRNLRRTRVAAIEQDLPISLELLATLSEAGFGFDAAIDKLLEMQDRDRALVDELRQFQREVLAGTSRVEALRRMDQRVGVPAMTVLTAALVQAEQVGASTAGVLRTQAEDLRSLRRERALAQAEALEVKLVFPLVICFLPGLFVAAVGPPFYEFVKLIDGLIRSGG